MRVPERPLGELAGLGDAPGAARARWVPAGELERPAVAAKGEGGAGELAELREHARLAAAAPGVVHLEQPAVIGGQQRPGPAQAPRAGHVRPRPLDGIPGAVTALGAARAALEGGNDRTMPRALTEQRGELA